MATFKANHKLRFSQTDYAGIMFYPRYYEMLNAVVEDWFADGLSAPFHDLLDDRVTATPLGSIKTEFLAPFRIGEVLAFELIVTRIGQKSVTLQIIAKHDDEIRIISKMTHICARRNLSGATPWPADIRDKMKSYFKEDADSCTNP